MIYRDSRNVYRSALLDGIPWLRHGFGTRNSIDWPPEPRVALKQIHSAVALIPAAGHGCAGEGDALLTDRPGVTLSVRTADCIPILIADPVRHAVAAVHAGWRGSARMVAVRAVERMASAFGSRPEDLLAAIGPGIGVCCYEVGPEVAGSFRPWFPSLENSRLDLPEANRRQLLETGLKPANIASGAPCTCCRPDEFHSFRRDRNKLRMVSAITLSAQK